MTIKPLSAFIGLMVVLMINSVGCGFRSAACKQREAAYLARRATLERDAHEKLRVGTKKDDLVRFFAMHELPLTLTRDEASGTISTTGCAPAGCGTDAAVLGLRVKVDEKGTVTSEPVIGGIYTNCL